MMRSSPHTVTRALHTDLYELTMAAGYFQNKIDVRATFELFCHKIPSERGYLISCGLQQAVEYILNLRFSKADVDFLRAQAVFKSVDVKFFEYLRKFKFTGDVWAIPEGEVFFEQEPVLQIEAPIIEAQILETYLLSLMNIGCLVASKAARVVNAACADGRRRTVIDFGSRRAHGPQAGVLAARAAYIGGCAGTSNVEAGRAFGVPTFGTMAHSWIEAFEDEEDSFKKFSRVFPNNAVILVDTYDTLAGAQKAARVKKIKGVRLDSGDLNVLSRKVRALLNRSGLNDVKIVASGNLNEYKIAELVKAKAPIDIFGVGTDMVVSRDVPALDLTYKLVQIEDAFGIKYKAKRSVGKATVPARKQVFRQYARNGMLLKDTIGMFSEKLPKSSPLLIPVIQKGLLLKPLPSVHQSRELVDKNRRRLPRAMKSLHSAVPMVPELSLQLKKIRDLQERVKQ